MIDTLKIGNQSFKRQMSSDVQQLYNDYQAVINVYEDCGDVEREFKNIKFYRGIEARDQWPENAVVNIETIQKRKVPTYNLAKHKIDGIAGSMLKNPFDSKFVPNDDSSSDLALALQDVYISDKELMDWNAHLYQAAVYGLLYNSWLRMHIKTSYPADPRGNIALECQQPGTIFADPDWKSRSNKDLDFLYRITWVSAEKLKNIYKKKSEEIDEEINFQKMMGMAFADQQGIDFQKDRETRRGNKFLLVEKHFLENQRVEREFDPVTGVVFWDWMTDEQKTDMAMRYEIPPDRIQSVTRWERVYKIQSICPDIMPTKFIEDSTPRIMQVGMLPFFSWSSSWINGKVNGMIELLMDAQASFNKMSSLKERHIAATVNGGTLADPAAFGNNDSEKRKFEQNRNNQEYVGWLKSNASRQFPNGGVIPIPRANIPAELFSIANEMVELMNLLVPQPPASEARTERSGESGIHYAQKLEVAKILQTPLTEGWRQIHSDIGEFYFFLAKRLYASHKNRTFFNADGSKKVVINNELYNGYGGYRIENDFSKLSRYRVVITESPAGVNVRSMQRELSINMMQNWPQTLPATGAVIAANAVRSLDMTDAEKERSDKMIELDIEAIKANQEAAVANAKVAIAQAMQMLGQAQQPPQASQGMAAPEGVPAPAGGGGGGEMQQLEMGPEVVEPAIGSEEATNPTGNLMGG